MKPNNIEMADNLVGRLRKIIDGELLLATKRKCLPHRLTFKQERQLINPLMKDFNIPAAPLLELIEKLYEQCNAEKPEQKGMSPNNLKALSFIEDEIEWEEMCDSSKMDEDDLKTHLQRLGNLMLCKKLLEGDTEETS